MNQVLRDKLERWLQSAPADPLTGVIEGNVKAEDQSPELRKALAVLEESRRAFATAKGSYAEAAAAAAEAQGTTPPDLATMRAARATMRDTGPASLGHYMAVVEAAQAVVPLVAATQAAARSRKHAVLTALRARLAKALADLGFAPTGTTWPAIYNQGVVPHPVVSIDLYVDSHPEVMPKAVELMASGVYGSGTYEVSAFADKAVREAAALLMELEED